MGGSRAIGRCEPCQVLTEAALNRLCGVPRVDLQGATGRATTRSRLSKNGCAIYRNEYSRARFVRLFFSEVVWRTFLCSTSSGRA